MFLLNGIIDIVQLRILPRMKSHIDVPI